MAVQIETLDIGTAHWRGMNVFKPFGMIIEADAEIRILRHRTGQGP